MPSKPKKEEKRSDPNIPFSVFDLHRKLKARKLKVDEAVGGPGKRTK